MNKYFIFIFKALLLNLTVLQIAYAHAPSKPAKCKDVMGIREMQDFKNDGSEFINYTKTPLYSAQSDETFFHYFAVNKALQRKLSPVVEIKILNNSNKVINSFKFDKWVDHSHFRELAYAKFNFQKFIHKNLNEPFDIYINLDKAERAKISLNTIPYSAEISVLGDDGKSICQFNYAYGANFH